MASGRVGSRNPALWRTYFPVRTGISAVASACQRLGNQKHPPSILEQVRALESLPGIERVGVMTGGYTVSIVANGVQSWLGFETTTSDFFATVGVAPLLGRVPSDEEIRAKSAVVVTTSAWRRLFPKRISLDGASVRIADRDYAVVGVLAPGFETLMARRMLAAYINLPRDRDSLTTDQRAAILQSSVQRVAEMPGVAAVSTQGYGRLEDDQVTSDVGREAEPRESVAQALHLASVA